MKEILPILDRMAETLGTTTEYLWGVLIKQAPLSAIIDVIQYSIIIVFWFFIPKSFRFIMKKVDDDRWEELWYVGPIIATIVLSILSIVAFFAIHNTITAIINPEYWALNKILSKIGHH
jgi:hypothetical protein